MKKAISSIVTLTMLFTLAAAGGGTKANNITTEAPKNFKLTQPDFHRLDPDLVKESKKKGTKVEGKELTAVKDKSYIKPKDTAKLISKDVRGKKKGIAILVDFPVENKDGKISDVPGVNYERVPMNKFNDLFNGTEYNPYDLDVFKDLAEYKVKDAAGNVINTIKAPTNSTLKNYYNEVSYNQFGIDVDLVGWYELPHSYDYYLGQNKGYNNVNGDAYTGELVKDAIKLADKDVDFSQYAVDAKAGDFSDLYGDAVSFKDKNGNTITQLVQNVFIIHRGTGAENSGDPNLIWSHNWNIISADYFGKYYQTGSYPADDTLSYNVADGVVVENYNMVPEVTKNLTGYIQETGTYDLTKVMKPAPAYPGVYCHEFGHMLGLPDQYDYGYDSEGTGMYTLMASGSYGRNIPSGFYSGNTPVNIDAWSKMYLGFASPKVITPVKGTKQTLTLRPSSEAPDIFKIDVPGSNGREYFLLENRQQKGFDQGLSYTVDGNNVHGLAVYHIVNDILVRSFSRPNEAANWDTNHTGKSSVKQFTVKNGEYHYGISLMQADGNYDMEKGINDGDSDDLFPGKNKVTSISSKGNAKVNTTSLYKWSTKSTETGIVIQNIKENADGTVTCNVVFTK